MDSIRSGMGDNPQPPRERMESHWRDVITEPAKGSVSPCTSRPTLDSLWDPITPREIKAARLDLSIAPGLDGLTRKQLREVPVNILVRILNLIMWSKRLPKHLIDARIIFIPEKPDAVDPADFRPNTIFSVLARLFHRICPRGLKILFSSVQSGGHLALSLLVAETTPSSLIPSFAVDMS